MIDVMQDWSAMEVCQAYYEFVPVGAGDWLAARGWIYFGDHRGNWCPPNFVIDWHRAGEWV